MRHATQAKVYQLIVETLQELGIPNGGVSINETTTLVQDGCEVGQSFVCGHVRVIMHSDGKRIEFRDESGGIFRATYLPQSFVGQAEAA